MSKRRVYPEDIQKCEVKFNKAKTVNSILRRVAENLDYNNEQLEDLYERTAWKLEEGRPPGSSYEVFKKAARYIPIFNLICFVQVNYILCTIMSLTYFHVINGRVILHITYYIILAEEIFCLSLNVYVYEPRIHK